MALTVSSLFCGAGGLDLGFERSGCNVVYANDIDRDSVETYQKNRPGTASPNLRDITGEGFNLKSIPSADILIGGPPCQGFSVAGHMVAADPRSQLVFTFANAVQVIRPRAFVMENVKALACLTRWSSVRQSLLRRLAGDRYDVQMFVLNASDFGVPQSRERVFFVGVRRGCGPQISRDSFQRLHRQRTARDVLAELGPPGSISNRGPCKAKVTIAKRPVLRKSPYAGMLFNGQGRPINLDLPSNTLPATMGGNRTPIVDEIALRTKKPNWVEWYHRRLVRDSGNVVRTAPKRLRRITVTEAALLQGFPDDYVFCGRQSSQYRQIGNAVPPRLAEAVAEAVINALSCRTARANYGQANAMLAARERNAEEEP